MNIDRAIDQVRKLRALSQSANENEAALAAQRAAEIIERYQIEEAALVAAGEQDDEEVEGGLDYREGKGTGWEGVLSYAVAASLGVKSYRTREWDRETNREVKRVRAIGRPSDVRAASYLYSLIAADINRLAPGAWEQVKEKAWETKRRWMNGYKLGAASTVAQRLRERTEKQVDAVAASAASDTALVVIRKRQEKVAALARRYGITKGRGVRTNSHSGYAAGLRDGRNVNIGGGRTAGALSA